MRIAVYARVSATEQSTEPQPFALRAYAVARGLELAEAHIYTDHGISGAKEHCQVRRSSPTRDQQADDRKHESHGAVVAALAERLAQPPWELDRDEVAAEQLHSAVRR